MKVPIKWLKDYLNMVVPPGDLANRLMMSGNEVKAVLSVGENWDNVGVARVTAISPHPNADKLRLATVDTGKGTETVVCGAWNFGCGDKVAFASIGAVLIDGHNGQTLRLKPAKIRGVESRGMICSEMELGISQEHNEILVLPADAPVGMSLQEYLGDTIIDLDVTPNRPDCLSIIGIAREAASLTGQPVHIQEPVYQETGNPIESCIRIEIEAEDLCSRYCASLISDVQIRPSPQWMQDRLIACGMRPINNVVDISNYVMLEYGQPLHTFDYDRIAGRKIIVRRASADEVITSLDGVERKLNQNMLVIADGARAVAVAGVMGGLNSEVTEKTLNILLEAASFKATSIHSTGEALGIPSESRYRFERGISAGVALPALKRATQLIVELGAGKAARGWIDVYPGRKIPQPVKLSVIRLKKLLGVDFTREQIMNTLVSLGIECRQSGLNDEIEAVAPYWRSDINIEEDLIEEVARIQGYDKIPNTLLADPLPPVNPDPLIKLKDVIRSGLTAHGFTEILNFSLVGRDLLSKIGTVAPASSAGPLRVTNPMTSDMEFLRTSLRGNLLNAFAANRRYQEGSIRLFELGRVYLAREHNLPDERETVCALMGGLRFERSWQSQNEVMDFFDAKGTIEGLLLYLGLSAAFEKGQDGGLHPGKQADIYIKKQKIGVVGEVHPAVALGFEINEPVYLIEMDLKALVQFAAADRIYRPIGKFPSTTRDMALIVASEITHQQIQKIITSFGLTELAEIFDVYAGEQVPPGKKSLAYRLTYRSPDHTLTDQEVNRVHQQILDRLNKELGAVLRS
ncbi:MAG TPA: phenylalanine--tRNA ligase subunit beta [Dehalococcoidales bacterium]|nr:phenylalanine--tRNA ligase subunit beta [Dehalococcoidales bacterium]